MTDLNGGEIEAGDEGRQEKQEGGGHGLADLGRQAEADAARTSLALVRETQEQLALVATRLVAVETLLRGLPDAIGQAVAAAITASRRPPGPSFPVIGGGNLNSGKPVEFHPQGRTVEGGEEKAKPQWKPSVREPKAPAALSRKKKIDIPPIR